MRGLLRLVSLPNGVNDAGFEPLEIVGIDAADEQVGAPEPHRVGPFVIVRATDEHIREARQLAADTLGNIVEQADHIDGNDRDLLPRMFQDDGTGHDRIVDFCRLAVLAEAGEPDRFLQIGRDVGFAEADEQGVRGLGDGARGQRGDEDQDGSDVFH